MNITVVGTGYVGLVSGTCFSEMGNNVTCIDVDENKINRLNSGQIPIYEPGLEELFVKNTTNGNLKFSTKLTDSLRDSDLVFCAVGTPPDENGSADLKYVLAVAKQFGENINKYTVIVTKSTVPVGTADKVRETVIAELNKRYGEVVVTDSNYHDYFDVASNPEFLKEGSAVKDFMNPDRIVVGVDSPKAESLLSMLYKPFSLNNPDKLIITDIHSSEMIKYAANSMLATRISFMNDIANLCELVGANVDMVRKGIGSDTRIGPKFLYPGCGYGGSCFPKDVKALIHTAKDNGYEMKVLNAVESVNEYQKTVLYKKLNLAFDGDLNSKCIGIWGLAFKPETDDMREATSLVLINELLENHPNLTIRVFDPIAMNECKRRMANNPNRDRIIYCDNKYDVIKGADALVLVTEWNEFRSVDFDFIYNALHGNHIVIDGRNVYDRTYMLRRGFDYYNIGFNNKN